MALTLIKETIPVQISATMGVSLCNQLVLTHIPLLKVADQNEVECLPKNSAAGPAVRQLLKRVASCLIRHSVLNQLWYCLPTTRLHVPKS